MTSLVYAVDVIGVTPVIETNIPDRIAAQIWNIHCTHGQLGYADLWSYTSNIKIGVCTPDEITKVGARYWWFIGDNSLHLLPNIELVNSTSSRINKCSN